MQQKHCTWPGLWPAWGCGPWPSSHRHHFVMLKYCSLGLNMRIRDTHVQTRWKPTIEISYHWKHPCTITKTLGHFGVIAYFWTWCPWGCCLSISSETCTEKLHQKEDTSWRVLLDSYVKAYGSLPRRFDRVFLMVSYQLRTTFVPTSCRLRTNFVYTSYRLDFVPT